MEVAITRLRVDRSRPERLTLMPNRPKDALATLTVDDWIGMGLIVDPDSQLDRRVLLNVESGEGRLRTWGWEASRG